MSRWARFTCWGMLLICALFLGRPATSHAADVKDIGVVMLHGMQGTPDSKFVKPFIEALTSAGVATEAPEMSWSRARNFDKTVEDSLSEIDAAVNNLKARGAKRIVIAGHSLGGAAALSYGARRTGLSGLILLAPAPYTSHSGYQQYVGKEVTKAKGMIDAGKGGATAEFSFRNFRPVTLDVTAKIYYSWNAPDGPASLVLNARKLKPGILVLHVVGDGEKVDIFKDKSFMFDRLPPHPKSKFVIISSDHMGTPADGASVAVEWLRSLE